MVKIGTLGVCGKTRSFALSGVLNRLTSQFYRCDLIIDALRNMLLNLFILRIAVVFKFHFTFDFLQLFRSVQHLIQLALLINSIFFGPSLQSLIINLLLLNCRQIANNSRRSIPFFVNEFFLNLNLNIT